MADEESGGDGGGERAYTEVTEIGYCQKLQRSCGGVAFGIFLFFASFVLLIWNEGRTVKRAKDIDEGREVVVAIDDVAELRNNSASFDGFLLYLQGDLSTEDSLYDPIFGVGIPPVTSNSDSNATQSLGSQGDSPLKLRRAVEMYQWIESSTTRTEKTSGGGERTITEYTYSQGWSTTLIDSSTFAEQRSDRVNPSSFPFDPAMWVAEPILLNEFLVLQDAAVDRLNWYEPVDGISVANVPDDNLAMDLSPYGSSGFFYSATDVASSNNIPVVGATRITFTQVPSSTISIIAAFSSSGQALGNYITEGGRSLLLLEEGSFTQEELFTQADNENTTTAWILRFVGFFLMFVSILLMLQPMAEAVDIIPFVGDYMQGGMEKCLFPAIAFLIAVPLSLFTIGLAWLAYRPAWSVPILIVSTGIIVWLCMRTKKVVNNASNNEEEEEVKVSVPPGYYHSSGTQGASSEAQSGFASALDEPSKPTPTEPDVPVTSTEPYVPQVYKP